MQFKNKQTAKLKGEKALSRIIYKAGEVAKGADCSCRGPELH